MITKTNQELFQKDEDVLLDTFLNASFSRAKNTIFYESSAMNLLEIIVTSVCNQKCEYCYFTKFDKQLNPLHVRSDKHNTINNIKMLMDYLVYEKKYIFQTYQLFAGDMFSTDLFFGTMEAIFPHFEYMYNKAPELFEIGHNERIIIIPCNMRFVEDDEVAEKVKEWVAKFLTVNIKLVFSWSHDGKYSSDVREKCDLDDEYYEKVFKFIQATDGGIHPMISYEGIHRAKDNFDWWVEMFKKYLPERVENGDYLPIHLEVRNDGWTDETIETYMDYLRYRLEYIFDMFDNDVDQVARYMFHVDGAGLPDYDQFDCVAYAPFNDVLMSCTMQNSMVVRASDLSIVPCHRLTYHQFLGGWFVTDDERTKIVDVKANNVGQLIDFKNHHASLAPECCICWNNKNCIHGCLGSQFEWSGEVYLPIPSVCKLAKAKTSFILKMFVDTGILKSAMQQNILEDHHKQHLLNLCRKLGYEA